MLDNEFHFMILKCFQNSNHLIMKEVNKLGLFSGQPKILEYLLENNGAKSVEIASDCVLDKSTVASILLRMEKMELIKREINEDDNRCFNIYLTDLGYFKAKEVKKIVRKVDKCAMEGLSEEEKDIFLKNLDKVINNLFNEDTL